MTGVVRTMCFSMLASVTAGTALVGTGAVTVRLTQRRAELPLALVPLLFGLQQLSEGLVWWSLDHDDASLDVAATLVYTLFARVLWPVFVPAAILCLEAVPWRRKVLGGCVALGAVVGLEGLNVALNGPRTAHVTGSSIQYAAPPLYVIALYVLATCVGAMVSSRRPLRLIGAAALVLALVTLWLYTTVFVSVWCFFSAVLSFMIFVYLWSVRGAARTRRPTGAST